jgi:hypothetical protein
MNIRSVFFLCFFTFTSLFVICSKNNNKNHSQKSPAKYLFLQQYNAMCHLAPMINLKLLEEFYSLDNMPKNSFDVTKIPATHWHSRREWFGIAYPYLKAWHVAFSKANDGGNDQTKNFHNYLANSLNDGPVMPHFYDKNSNFYFTGTQQGNFGTYLLNVNGFIKFTYTPYLLIDIDAVRRLIEGTLANDISPGLGLTIPLVSDENNKYSIFDLKKKVFVPFNFEEGDKLQNSSNTYEIHRSISDGCDWIRNTPLFVFESEKKDLGFKKLSCSFDLAQGFKPPKDSVNNKILSTNENEFAPYATYTSGLYKLMFLMLGIGPDNRDLSEQNELYKVFQELKTINNEDSENNPWSKKYFSKEKFLPYQIAKIFQDDPALFARAREVVDFSILKIWASYSNFLKLTEKGSRKAKIFKDRQQTPYVYDEIIKYLPGKEQMLAYAILCNIRLLWYCTTSDKTFYDTTFPSVGYVKSFFTGGVTWSLEEYVEGAREKNDCLEQMVSFIDVWQEILGEIKKHCQERLNWISFDGHGWVVSLDEKLISLQKKSIENGKDTKNQKTKRIKLLDEIGCTGIESWQSSNIESFYKEK